MEQREEWLEWQGDVPGEEVNETTPEIDARLAAWISSVSAPAAARYLNSSLSLPEPPAGSPGVGEGWHERAVSDVLSRCYSEMMLDPNLERVEEIAISEMPLPTSALDDEDDERRPLFSPPPVVMWERAISSVSGKVAGILRYGPSAGFVEGEVVVCAEDLRAEVRGLVLRQRVDLLWRHPDGELEAVIVAPEPDCGRPPHLPAEDWRVILASEIVASSFGAVPTVHLVRVQTGVAQAVRPSRRHLANSILRLVRAANEARACRNPRDGTPEAEMSFTYPLDHEAVGSLQRGDWPGGRPGPNRRPGGRPRR